MITLESVLKPSMYPDKDASKADKSPEIESLPLISEGKAAAVFEFEEVIFHQMAFFVCMPVSFSGMLGNDTAGENHNSASFRQPAYKLIAVIAFVRQYEFAVQIKGFQQK